MPVRKTGEEVVVRRDTERSGYVQTRREMEEGGSDVLPERLRVVSPRKLC
jgi:hypothetical protein